jgi:uncharacterized membrane protein YfcA
MTLATMLCGYGSGVIRNLRQGSIDGGVVRRYLPFTVPAALVGGYLAPALNVSWLILLFGIFVLGAGVRMFVQITRKENSQFADKRLYRLPHCAWARVWLKGEAGDRGLAVLGGILLGLITVGMGELLLPRLLAGRKSLSPAQVVGSTVLVIFATSLAAALVRLNGPLLTALGEQRATLLGAILFAAPGVVLGGHLGPMLARRLNMRGLRWYVAMILLLVGALMLVRFLALAALAQ